MALPFTRTLTRELPKNAVELTLRAGRLPLSVAERLRGKQDADWAPALYYAGVESMVRRAAGTVLGDEQMRRRGRLGEAAVYHAERAEQLREDAEATKRQAAAREASRKAAAARERDRKLRQADATAARRAAKLASAREQAHEAVDAEERNARAVALAAEERSVEAQRAAVSSVTRVTALDEALAESRKAGRS
jgi:hypothetical protein